MSNKYEDAIRLKKKIIQLDKKRKATSLTWMKKHYLNRVNNGDWSEYCMAFESDNNDWDEFEKETQVEVSKEVEEEQMAKIGKRVKGGKMNDRIVIRVHKGDNFVEMERNGIKSQDELDNAREFLLQECRNTLNSLPNELKRQESVTPNEYGKKYSNSTVYDEKKTYNKKDVRDINKYISDRQAFVISQQLNNKELTIQQVESIGKKEDGSYDREKTFEDIQVVVFKQKGEIK